MAAKISVLGLIPSSFSYLRSAMARFPFQAQRYTPYFSQIYSEILECVNTTTTCQGYVTNIGSWSESWSWSRRGENIYVHGQCLGYGQEEVTNIC